MQLALGTVQFGLNYGVANQTGQVDKAEMQQILSQAWQKDISVLDTAPAYGNAETRIGDYCQLYNDHQFKIVTKFSSHVNDELQQQFFLSLKSLQQTHVYALLLHSIQSLRKPDSQLLWDQLIELKKQGKILKIGVSVYHPDEIDFLLENFAIDIIQLPLNIFDQRAVHLGQLAKLQKRGIEIHVRSIFLQGLLLMPLAQAQYKRPQARDVLGNFHQFCRQNHISPLSACLQFVRQHNAISHIVVGAQTTEQLNEINDAWQLTKNLTPNDFSWCSQTDLAIIDPSRWS